MPKEKTTVVGEELDEIKVARFLEIEPYGEENADFHMLLKAYRGLPPEPFGRFLQMFCDSGRDINAKGLEGRSLLEVARQNIRHEEYVGILQEFGAV